jgi:hypothetical protein
LILNAIAEAEALGLHDFASDIERAFGKQSQLPAYERGSCVLSRSPRERADYQRVLSAPRAQADYQRVLSALPRVEAVLMASPPVIMAPAQEAARQATEEEILAVLHTDPTAFLAMIASGRPPMIDVSVEAVDVSVKAVDVSVEVVDGSFSGESPVEFVAQVQETPLPRSPLSSVTDDAWSDFVFRLARESPTFDSSRHIGQYRQRRDRLAELGIDPASLHGSPSAQRAALDVDLADAHGHAVAGGLLEYLGSPIVVPGHECPEKITLSGVLGVIQCAGLEGAAGWLAKASDRRRYPHTTQAFLRSNGAF